MRGCAVTRVWIGALALAAMTVAGCYRSHTRDDGGTSPASDAGAVEDDTGPPRPDAGPGPCETVCDAPRVIASVSFGAALLEPWAVLDFQPVGDALVALTLVTDLSLTGRGTRRDYRLLRVPLTTGTPRFEAHPPLITHQAVGAGAIRATGDGMRVVALTADAPWPTEPQLVQVIVATWASVGGEPTISVVPLRETPIPGCMTCYRLGAAVLLDDTHAIAALAAEDEMYVIRIRLADLSVQRWSRPIPGASADSPLGGVSDGSGRVLLTAGGSISEFGGSYGGGAFVLSIDAADVREPFVIPGDRLDPPPHGILFEDRAELVRFTLAPDATTGVIRRYAIGPTGLEELPSIETAGGLPPLAITSTRGVLLWAEVDLALPGAGNLHALAHSPTCTSERPVQVAHLPAPLGDIDPRTIAATEHEGRTYVFVIERQRRGEYFGTVLDLGRCRTERTAP